MTRTQRHRVRFGEQRHTVEFGGPGATVLEDFLVINSFNARLLINNDGDYLEIY